MRITVSTSTSFTRRALDKVVEKDEFGLPTSPGGPEVPRAADCVHGSQDCGSPKVTVVTAACRVLLTPGDLGPGEWSDVATVLSGRGNRVLLDTDLSYDRGVLAAAGTQLQRLRDPTFWNSHSVDQVDLAVGFGSGAGPATAMVAEGRARSAVLIDPDLAAFAMKHPEDLDLLVPDAGFDLAAEIADRLEPYSDNLRHGPFTREMVDILCGAFTGESWRIRQAELVASFLTTSVTIDRSLQPTSADLDAADWITPASAPTVKIWLTAGHESIAEALGNAGLDATLTAWRQAPWVHSAEEVARAIELAQESGPTPATSH